MKGQLSLKSSIWRGYFFKGPVYDWDWSLNTGVHTHTKITCELYSPQPHAHAPSPKRDLYLLKTFLISKVFNYQKNKGLFI